MTENIKAYHQACVDQFNQQDALNRHYYSSTIGMLAFGATIFSIEFGFDAYTEMENTYLPYLIFGVILAIMFVLGIFIIFPMSWKRQFNISDVRDHLGKEHKDFLLMMGDAYERAIQWNAKIISRKGHMVRWLAILTCLELLVFIYLQFFPI